MKVAFTSTDGKSIDEHFGQCHNFYVWEIDAEDARPVSSVAAHLTDGDEEDRIAARADAISDCAIVYTMQIGGPAAAKLVARKIHPMKTGIVVPVEEVVGRIQQVLRGTPPPWLRKAMNKDTTTASFLPDDL